MSRGQPKKDTSGAGANKPTKAAKANGNGAKFGFEAQMFLAADKLRKNLEPSDYKHVALGLIFLKHISNAFEAKHAQVLAEDPAAAEDPDEYLAENVFWVPKEVPAILIFLGGCASAFTNEHARSKDVSAYFRSRI